MYFPALLGGAKAMLQLSLNARIDISGHGASRSELGLKIGNSNEIACLAFQAL
jgi:hypothetical protein